MCNFGKKSAPLATVATAAEAVHWFRIFFFLSPLSYCKYVESNYYYGGGFINLCSCRERKENVTSTDANDSLNRKHLANKVLPAGEAKYKISHISQETNMRFVSAL